MSGPATTELSPVLPKFGRPSRPAWPLMSYSRGAGKVPLRDDTVGEALRRTVERFGDHDALIVRHQGHRATYLELWGQVDRAAKALLALDVHRGDRIGIWAPNRFEWVVIQFATARVGAVLVTINPDYQATELRHALTKAGVSWLVMARGYRGTDYVATLASVRADCPQLRAPIVLEDDWDEFMAAGSDVSDADLAEREATLDAHDPINIQYTSGTTGTPKGATLSHYNIVNNAHQVANTLRYTENDRACVPMPFYHCFGMVLGTLACVTHGAAIVIPGESFDPTAVLAAVEAERCTALHGVPTMFIAELAVLDTQRFDLSTLRTGMMGGAPCPADVMQAVRTRMHLDQVTIVCGMTETAPVSTQTALDDPAEKRVGTVGRAHPHVEIKIVDPQTGATVPRGTPGEQCTRGYGVMLGYWDDPAATAAAIDDQGWMHSGDLAVMDPDGYLRIVGRIKDMIIRGGENIYPREIEEFLHTLPEISDVHVIGVPSDRYGEEVMAWVRLRPGVRLNEAELAAACRGRIAAHKIPRYWRVVDEFPMTVTGKVQKFRMRAAAAQSMNEQAA